MSGVQGGTVRLAEALAQRGNTVTIYNNRVDRFDENGVGYRPIAERATISVNAVVVTNNDLALLTDVPARRRAVWARLNIDLKALRKKGHLMIMLHVRPHIVFPSNYTARRSEIFLPFRSRQVIEHGIEQSFLNFTPLDVVPPRIAMFCSQPRRNLDLVVAAWRERIRPRISDAQLHIYYPKENQRPTHLEGLEHEGIEIRGSVGKATLAEALRSAKVMIYPGHKEETFCNAAAEAVSAGLPLVTMGIGSLAERVRHGIDGYIARTYEAMGDSAAEILENDDIWRKMHAAGIESARGRDWRTRAAEWEAAADRWN